jgi:hypothetical protein
MGYLHTRNKHVSLFITMWQQALLSPNIDFVMRLTSAGRIPSRHV